jgi:hypothetical protein
VPGAASVRFNWLGKPGDGELLRNVAAELHLRGKPSPTVGARKGHPGR